MKRLVVSTVLRVEALRYFENLFPGDQAFASHAGWKMVASRDFERTLRFDDAVAFVRNVAETAKKSDSRLVDFDAARVAAGLFTHCRYNVPENRLAFIIKSRAAIRVVGHDAPLPVRALKGFWNGFKRAYNRLLDAIRM